MMDPRSPLGPIPLPGSSSPECLAIIEYWDEHGRVCVSSVLPDSDGWCVESGDGSVWRAEKQDAGIAFRRASARCLASWLVTRAMAVLWSC